MPSLHARLLSPKLRLTLRRRLGGDGAAIVRTLRARAEVAASSASLAIGAPRPFADGSLRGEWHPSGDDALDRAILYLHDGCYVAGSAAAERGIARALAAATGAPVLALDYRLAPEHRFPAALDDAIAAFETLRRRLPASAIALAGTGSGGGLALATAQALRARDPAGSALPAAVVAFSPWTDLALGGTSVLALRKRDAVLTAGVLGECAAAYAPGAGRRDPRASPHYGSAAGLPPVFLAASDDELLRDDAVRFADRLRAAGSDVVLELRSNVPHGWPIYSRLPEARRTVSHASRFLRDVWDPTGAFPEAVKRRA